MPCKGATSLGSCELAVPREPNSVSHFQCSGLAAGRGPRALPCPFGATTQKAQHQNWRVGSVCSDDRCTHGLSAEIRQMAGSLRFVGHVTCALSARPFLIILTRRPRSFQANPETGPGGLG